MNRVFISYSREDLEVAESICTEFENYGIPYFQDVKSMSWGDDIDSVVSNAIITCGALIVLMTIHSAKSQWVPYEIGYATAYGKPILIFQEQKGMQLPSYLSKYKYISSLNELKENLKNKSEFNNLLKESKIQASNLKLEELYLVWWEEQNSRRGDVIMRFDDISFNVDRRVFSPELRLTYSSYFSSIFITSKFVKRKEILDLGSGCGILAILAAKRGAKKVIAIENDPIAVENTQNNINNLIGKKTRKIKVLEGDLFEPLLNSPYTFDIIFANLPIAFKTPFWKSHSVNFKSKFEEFFSLLGNYLKPTGKAFVSWASFGDTDLLIELLTNSLFEFKLHIVDTFGVKWYVYEVFFKKPAQ